MWCPCILCRFRSRWRRRAACLLSVSAAAMALAASVLAPSAGASHHHGRPVFRPPVDAPVTDPRRADFDRDGYVGFGDFMLFARGFGASSSDPNFDANLDLNGDERISFADFILFAAVFGMAAGG